MTYSNLALLLLCSLNAVQAAQVWTVNCDPLSVQRSDPIVSPGVPSGHVHAISGGTAFNRTMLGIDAAVDAAATTCDKYTDHSNYWCPQLYNRNNGMFEIVPYTGANMYYKSYTCDYDPTSQWCPTVSNAKPFPPGLRILAGDPDRRTQNSSSQADQAILYETGNSGEMYGFPETLANNLQLNVRFPSCWDGLNFDSPDHKSHMSYPGPTKGNTEGGMCPESHPVALISIGAEFGFDTGSLGISSSATLVFSNGDTTGYGGHGDFIQGWQNLTALGESFNDCEGTGAACAWNAFGTPDGSQGQKSVRSPETPAPVENIGLTGPISTLPGGNEVYVTGQTAAATAAASSAAAAVMSDFVAVASSSAAATVVGWDAASQTEVAKVVATPAPTPTSASQTWTTVYITRTITNHEESTDACERD